MTPDEQLVFFPGDGSNLAGILTVPGKPMEWWYCCRGERAPIPPPPVTG